MEFLINYFLYLMALPFILIAGFAACVLFVALAFSPFALCIYLVSRFT